jgi:glutamate/tyrosine decarboxylase-like PLP-dependent enzyme
MDEDPLALTPAEMRELGHRMVDLTIERMSTGRPGLGRVGRDDTEARIDGAPPEEPVAIDELLTRLDAASSLMARTDHPGFFAFIPGEPTWPGALADLYASALNLHASDWMESPGPSQVELTVIDWLRGWVGYPAEAGGVFGSGGSAANMTALACAREVLVGAMRDDVVAYVSDQAHSSLARAARILGFRPEQVRVLPVDERFRMRPESLAPAMDSDLRAGRRPLFVAAAAGSTNTGAIDPLPELAEVCRERGAWFHVDAAYGGGVLLTEPGRGWLAGIELADSVTLDAHKWLYQPYECGVLLVRDLEHLHRAFEISPDYLKDTESALREPNFADLGMQLTRSARALKLWVSLQYFGVGAFRRAVERALDIAAYARERIEASEVLELVAPPSLGVLCFRRLIPGASEEQLEAANARIVPAIANAGESFISSTRLRGRYALRLVVMNHSTQRAHVDRLLDAVETMPFDTTLPSAAPVPLRTSVREGIGVDGFVRGGGVSVAALAAVPLFRGLSTDDLVRIARLSHEREVAAGDPLIEQWENSRELLVLLDGTAEVRSGEHHLRDVPTGDFVGEIAALEWHAGFTYPRTAAVTATSPVRLLVIPSGLAPRLAKDLPVVGERLRAALKERLPTV